MIYYPDESSSVNSWASGPLQLIGYNSNPHQNQAIIRSVFELGTRRIRIPGVDVGPVALFDALDGKTSEHFVHRVEPSAVGGELIANHLMNHILKQDFSARERPNGGHPMSR